MIKKYTSQQLAIAFKTACMTELQALKPGNVHVFADGHGMTIQDFIKSADVTADIIARADLTVGERIYYATELTHQAVGQNTNLGMLLLCAPVIHAAIHHDEAMTLRQGVADVLARLTVDDARLVAKAIVLANPGGLGKVQLHDVHDAPDVTLLEMMRVAQDYDRIAWQYTHTFDDVFDTGCERYRAAMRKWDNPVWATTALYLEFLSSILDTHIIRKYGAVTASEVLLKAAEMDVLHYGADNPKLVQKRLLDWDASLKARSINPGTSADLTVATLLVAYLE